MSFSEYLRNNQDHIVDLSIQHVRLSMAAVLFAGLAAMLIGAAVHANKAATAITVAGTAAVFTVPSLALVGLLIPVTGLTENTVLIMLVPYGLVPVLRNTITGLQGVDSTVLDSARGVGMGPVRILLRVKLPLAWPTILAGLRISTQLVLGVAAIAVYVTRVGLGVLIDQGFARFGLPNSTNQALAGTLGVVVLAIGLDVIWQLLGRLTTPRGLRV